MALSSHDKHNHFDKKIGEIYSFYNGKFQIYLSYFNYYTFDRQKNFFSKKFVELFGPPRKKNEKILIQHRQLASAMQRHFEMIVVRLLKLLKQKSNSENLILGGGAAAAMSEKDAMGWSIPLGVVSGALIGCQVDGG